MFAAMKSEKVILPFFEVSILRNIDLVFFLTSSFGSCFLTKLKISFLQSIPSLSRSISLNAKINSRSVSICKNKATIHVFTICQKIYPVRNAHKLSIISQIFSFVGLMVWKCFLNHGCVRSLSDEGRF